MCILSAVEAGPAAGSPHHSLWQLGHWWASGPAALQAPIWAWWIFGLTGGGVTR